MIFTEIINSDVALFGNSFVYSRKIRSIMARYFSCCPFRLNKVVLFNQFIKHICRFVYQEFSEFNRAVATGTINFVYLFELTIHITHAFADTIANILWQLINKVNGKWAIRKSIWNVEIKVVNIFYSTRILFNRCYNVTSILKTRWQDKINSKENQDTWLSILNYPLLSILPGVIVQIY